MKKTLVLGLGMMISFAGLSNSKYSIDDSKVEAAFEKSVVVNPEFQLQNSLGTEEIQADKNVWVAVALGWFLGGIAIHRVYLGTPPGIIAGYLFTGCGIFGIIPIIDIIVLAINNEDISAYVDKKGYIMF